MTTTTTKRAVIYLRVSTRDQAKRGGETEGFSIPAQREACHRKAESLGAEVIEEFIDAGERRVSDGLCKRSWDDLKEIDCG